MCILIYNDSSYAAEVHYFRRQGFSVDIVQFPETDFAAIARGYGARGATVRTLDDLEPVRAWVAEVDTGEASAGVDRVIGRSPHLSHQRSDAGKGVEADARGPH